MGMIPDPLGITEHTAVLARLDVRHFEQAARQAARLLWGPLENQESAPATPASPASLTAPTGLVKTAPSSDPTLHEKLHALLVRALS